MITFLSTICLPENTHDSKQPVEIDQRVAFEAFSLQGVIDKITKP